MNGKRPQQRKRRKRTRWSKAKPSYEDSLAYAGSMLFSRSRINTPLPLKLKANLRYAYKGTMDIGASGAADTDVFSAAGMFDPYITGVSNQPRGFDELQALYRKHTVLGSKITVWLVPNSGNGPILGAVNLKSISTTDASIPTSAESSYCSVTAHAVGEGAVKMVQTYSPAFVGTRNALDDDNLHGSSTANPANNSYYHVVAESAGSADEAAFPYFAVIEYHAVFHDPIRPAQS